MDNDASGALTANSADRRGFLSTASTLAMGVGLAAGYGTFVAMAGRFLYPAGPSRKGWMFVTRADSLRAGQSLVYRTPTGASVVIARQAAQGTVDDFIALSSVCPHLGCQVHWELQNQRFFCPCHNGTFDPQGVATDGPPAAAGQSLPRYPLTLRDGLLFIEVPLEGVTSDFALSASKGGSDADGNAHRGYPTRTA